ARLRQCPPVELLDRVRVRRYLLRRQLVPRLVEQGGAEVLRGGEALPVLGRAEQRLAQLLGQRLTGAVVARIAREHLRVARPHLVDLGGELDEVAGHRGPGQGGVPHGGEQER